MIKEISSKFNVYDFIGYIWVGLIGLGVIQLNVMVLLGKNYLNNIIDFVIVLILAYFLGHMIQAISNVFIKENKTRFSNEDETILLDCKKYFKLKTSNFSKLFSLCYLFASSYDISGQVKQFNSYYSLYRGWQTIFILNSISSIILLIFNWFNFYLLLILIVSITSSLLCRNRRKRFYDYLRSKTLNTFLILKRFGVTKK